MTYHLPYIVAGDSVVRYDYVMTYYGSVVTHDYIMMYDFVAI